ncbi:hypothetical protein O181_063024 [Austropuccinia psidii MF-1]|uniref:Uncharacterized protein n=1 Tax=Austropuccinia psidii MF-1 TaxID=1389203 RepID=A0A9Q3ELK4_9BASI|nr:hypothetical protein [Austropuccinia psidii MF-1]
MYDVVLHTTEKEDADADSSNQLSDGDVIKEQGPSNGDEEFQDEDEEDNNPAVHDQWTRDINEEMGDSFENIYSTLELISKGKFEPKV